MRVEAKHVLITGGGSGIGLAVAKAMVSAGARVTITGRDPAKLDAAVRGTPQLTARVCDVTDDSAVVALRDALVAGGGVDILINNAGVMEFFDIQRGHPLEEQIAEIDVDAIGPVRLVHHFLPSLLTREAIIVNVSSGLAYVPFASAPIYSAAKTFVHAYTQCLREQLKDTRVRVVELLPPIVATQMAAGVDYPIPAMPPEKLAAALMRGLRRGKTEIAPGYSAALKWLSRIAPGFGFAQVNRKRVTKG